MGEIRRKYFRIDEKSKKIPDLTLGMYCLQGAERAAETVVGESGDTAVFQVHESRQRRSGQPGV